MILQPLLAWLGVKEPRQESIIYRWIFNSYKEASCTTQPAFFLRGYDCVPPYFASSPKKNISLSKNVPRKSSVIFFADKGNVFMNDSVVSNMGRVDDRNACVSVIRSVQLASKGPCLDSSLSIFAKIAQR